MECCSPAHRPNFLSVFSWACRYYCGSVCRFHLKAAAAVAALNGTWPSSWPARHDGKKIRAMPKSLWECYKKEFQALQRSARSGTPASSSRVPPFANHSLEQNTSHTIRRLQSWELLRSSCVVFLPGGRMTNITGAIESCRKYRKSDLRSKMVCWSIFTDN